MSLGVMQSSGSAPEICGELFQLRQSRVFMLTASEFGNCRVGNASNAGYLGPCAARLLKGLSYEL